MSATTDARLAATPSGDDRDLAAVLASLDVTDSDRSQISDAEASFLFREVRDRECTATLEIGCGLGKSAVAIMLASRGPHTAVDPFQANYEFRGLANVERAGFGSRLELLAEPSRTALPRLVDAGRRFDFVFVDGSHRFDDILLDFTFADLLLVPGGVVVLDDLVLRPTRLVVSYVRRNRPDYVRLRGVPRSLAALQKVGRDERDGMFHREFCTPRGLLADRTVRWLGSGEGPARRAVLRAKRLVYR